MLLPPAPGHGPRTLLSLAAVLLLSSLASGQRLEVALLWADRVDFGGAEVVEGVVMEAELVAGAVVGEGLEGPSRVVARDRSSGEPLWRRRLPERVTDLVGRSNGILTTGLLRRGSRPPRIVTRFLHSEDGTERFRRFESLRGDEPAPPAIVRLRNTQFVVGGSADRFRVTALDLGGRLLWRHASEPAGDVLAEELRVAVRGLLVAGTRHRAPGRPSPMVVRRHDEETGELLWETELEAEGVGVPRAIGGGGPGVVVVGETLSPDTGLPRWTVHALDSRSGEPLWTDMPFPGHRASSAAAALTFFLGDPEDNRSGSLYVVGELARARRLPVIRAYGRDGALLWQRRGPAGRGGTFTDVDFHRFRGPVAVGSGRQAGDRVDRVVAMSFDAADGGTLWRRFGPAGVGGSRLNAVVAGSTPFVFAGGRLGRPGATAGGLLHLYRAESGLTPPTGIH